MQQPLPKLEFQDLGGGYLHIVCRGELSWEDRSTLAPEVERQLSQRAGITGVIVDLGDVTFVSSAGIGALFSLLGAARDRGLPAVLAQVPARIARVFEAVGLDRLAQLETTLAGACDFLCRGRDAQTDAPAPTTLRGRCPSEDAPAATIALPRVATRRS